jgi:glutathione S-transferase
MITIYGVPISVHVRKTVVTAMLKGIDHKLDPVIPFNPPQGWDRLSPTGLIPVMADGAFTLPDSTAICCYLERKHATPPILPKPDRDAARVLWLDSYAGVMFRELVRELFFQKILRPGILKETTDQTVVDDILATRQPKFFAYLDSQAAAGPQLVGDALTLADIAIVSNLINYQYLGFAIDGTKYPNLARYTRSVLAQPVFRRALEDEKPFAEQMGLNRSFV